MKTQSIFIAMECIILVLASLCIQKYGFLAKGKCVGVTQQITKLPNYQIL